MKPSPALQFSLDFGLISGKDSAADQDGKDPDGPASAASGAADAIDAKSGAESPARLITQSNQPPVAPDPASQMAAMPTELTFAVKVGPHTDAKATEAGKDSGKPLEAAPARTAAPSKDPATAVTAIEEAHRAEPQSDASASRTDTLSRLAAFQAPPQNSPGGGPEGPAEPRMEPAKALETASLQTPAAESSGKAAGPLKDISIQVGQTPQDRVELRVVDRSGEVQVAVRASNPDVAQGLRQGLSDLVDRLQQSGYRAEAWRPGGTVSSIQGTGESRQKEMQFQRDGSQPQSGGSQQGRQQNSQSQTYRPKWVQELEGSLSGANESIPGDSYGIAS